jgi:hypothetical protein
MIRSISRAVFNVSIIFRCLPASVRNNVQAGVGPRPVDFIAMQIPRANLMLPPDQTPHEDVIWLYANEERQALILARHEAAGKLELRYLPVCGLRQDFDGSIHFEPARLTSGFPLRIFEDPDLAVPDGGRIEWLNSWHSELEWLQAVHRTKYSNGILAVHEQFLEDLRSDSSADAALLQRFKQRRRRLVEPDFLIFASDHWNFNVRGFNPGGNHGSFLRISRF